MSLLRKGTSISKLRILSSPHSDSHSLRRHVERDLASQSLLPPGMNDEGILCIRHLSDAAPGMLGAAQPDGSRLATWDQATREALSYCLRSALRPYRGQLPPDAASVYFPSEAELLACLALSKTRHTFRQEWWWNDLLGASRLTLPWSVFWIEAPTAIVSAITLLAKDERLHEVLSATSPTQIETLHRVVTHCHVVSPALRTLVPSRGTLSPFSENVTVSGSPFVPPHGGNLEVERELARQISHDLPELSLFEPGSPSFQFALTTLLVKRNPAGARRVTSATLAHLSELRSSRMGPAPKEASPPHTATPRSTETSSTTPGNKEPVSELSDSSQTAPAPREKETEVPTSRSSAESSPLLTPVFENVPTPRSSFHGTTELGGIFYLLNLALHFGLYSDFTQPRGFNLSLSPWDFLSEIARRLFPETPPEDPLWELLAGLSGKLSPERRQALWLAPTPWQPPIPAKILEALRANEGDAEAWLTHLAPYLASRVRTASGLEPETWLRAPATYRLTDDRFDVHFALARHPVELRFAGLDRNPGWIPAANLSVYFHYE